VVLSNHRRRDARERERVSRYGGRGERDRDTDRQTEREDRQRDRQPDRERESQPIGKGGKRKLVDKEGERSGERGGGRGGQEKVCWIGNELQSQDVEVTCFSNPMLFSARGGHAISHARHDRRCGPLGADVAQKTRG